MKPEDIPDKIQGMHELPIRLHTLYDVLDIIGGSCIADIPADKTDIAEKTHRILKGIQDEYGDAFPPAALAISCLMTKALMERFSQEIVIDHSDD